MTAKLNNVSIKQRIYVCFSLLVFLFVINGVITNITLNNNKKLSTRLSKTIEPSLQSMEDFRKLMLESKMYTTNWVFLRSNQEDKELLKSLHQEKYTTLKTKINSYSANWNEKRWIDTLNRVFVEFEQLLDIE